MQPSPKQFSPRTMQWVLLLVLLALSWLVLAPFVKALLWAAILCFIFLPLHHRVLRWCKNKRVVASLLSSLLVALFFIVPLLGFAKLALAELQQTSNLAMQWFNQASNLAVVQNLIGQDLLQSAVLPHIERVVSVVSLTLSKVSLHLSGFAFAMIALFFFFLEIETLKQQLNQAAQLVLAGKAHQYLSTVSNMTQAVVWGILLTALAQGATAGIGYWWLGISHWLLLTAVTALFAIIPFGAPLCWGTVVLVLLGNGDYWTAVGLLAWGMVVVSSIDNIIRPIVISQAAHFPFLFVLMGVLGGLAAFGLIGLFIGPIILAVSLAVWQQWLQQNA